MNLNGKKINISRGKLVGTALILLGTLFLLIGIGVTIFLVNFDKNLPEDVQWYEATISEVTSVDKKVERKESTNNRYRYETTYDCEVYLEYEINGVEQRIPYSINGSYVLPDAGDIYYVKVSPSEPAKIHVFSKEPDDSVVEVGPIVLAIVGVITIIVGIIVRKLAKIAKVVDRRINYSENDDRYYNVTYESNDYSGTSIK